MIALRVCFLCCLLGLISSCSWIGGQFNNHALDYLEEKPKPTLPKDDLIEAPYSQAYPVVNNAQLKASSTFVLPRPKPLDMQGMNTQDSYSLNAYKTTDSQPSLAYDGAGTRILKIHSPFATSWSEVLQALSKTQFKVADMNRSTGVYYLEIPQKADKTNSSWWWRLFHSDSTVMQTFLLKMDSTPAGVVLSLLTDGDTLAKPKITERVLTAIRDKLIQ